MIYIRAMKRSPFHVLAFFAALMPATVAGQSPIPNRESSFIIYYDRSPGSLPIAQLWQSIAASGNHQFVFCTSAEDFSSKLTGDPWMSVLVIERRSSGEPAFATALRAYATAHPGRAIRMYHWHDHGEQPENGIGVLGTTAVSIWHRGHTTTAYALAQNSNDQGVRAQTIQSLTFPGFVGVNSTPLVAVGGYTEVILEGAVQSIHAATNTQCELNAINQLITETQACQINYATHTQLCHDLFMPTDSNPGDPAAWIECLNEASEDYMNCLSATLHRYKRRIQYCDAQIVPAPPPQPVP